MKVVINNCFGGFSLSEAVYKELGADWDGYGYDFDDDRDDPDVIKAIETVGLGRSAGVSASLKIVEIPDDIKYCIEEYDGMEHIAEVHRTWY